MTRQAIYFLVIQQQYLAAALVEAQIPLRRLCDKVRDKFPTKSRTCRGHKSWKSATQITSPIFMICVLDKSATLSRTCSRTSSRTLSQTSRHVEMVCVCDFRNLCPLLSPWGSFGESRRNGIWALTAVACLWRRSSCWLVAPRREVVREALIRYRSAADPLISATIPRLAVDWAPFGLVGIAMPGPGGFQCARHRLRLLSTTAEGKAENIWRICTAAWL